jgi:hypothetical protein
VSFVSLGVRLFQCDSSGSDRIVQWSWCKRKTVRKKSETVCLFKISNICYELLVLVHNIPVVVTFRNDRVTFTQQMFRDSEIVRT